MNLLLDRKWKKADYTIGILYVNGVRFCEVLEDAVRAQKIPGKTAIPAGDYIIDMHRVSPRFQNRAWARPYGGCVPHLMHVPNYDGVLIHPGNTAADTEGCLLVGRNTSVGKVLESQATFKLLMDKHLIPASQNHERITITIL